jgi:hypothetical protein
MAWKLKLDENGNPVLKDGKPIYLKDDGSELVFDAEQAFTKIGQLTGENTDYKKRFNDAEAKVKAFEGIDDPEAARKALETIKNLDDGKLVTAGKAEEIKVAAQKAAEDRIAATLKQSNDRIAALEQERNTFKTQLEDEMIGGGFARSKFIQEKIAIPPDMVKAAFGRAFKVEDGKAIAYDQSGKPIYSRQKMGEVADFDEALEILIDQYPYKDQIMKGSGSSGSGASNGAANQGGKRVLTRAQFNSLDGEGQRAAAIEAGQGKAVIMDS